MLRAVLVYSADADDKRTFPIIQCVNLSVLKLVAQAGLEESRRVAKRITDPVLAALLQGEIAKSEKVLKRLGLVG